MSDEFEQMADESSLEKDVIDSLIDEQTPAPKGKKVEFTESPISGNVRGYYKGYSVQITCRDPERPLKPLLVKMMQVANFMDARGFKPSWNDETNEQVREEKPEAAGHCSIHNAPMEQKISKKTGNPYIGHWVKGEGMCFGGD